MSYTLTYKLYLRKYIFVITTCCFINFIYAQQSDSIKQILSEVTVSDYKTSVFQPSKKNVVIDSFILQKYTTGSLAELLNDQSTIHIKSYGNGNIATTSMRGGNANHTALIWNGLNIQNPMLGQNDLSLISNLLFDKVTVEYGGSSSLWGSGALGGSIQLQNKTMFNTGLHSKLQVSLGSFQTKKIGTVISLSYPKLTLNTRIYYNHSKNNYPYIDTLDKEKPNKEVKHANYEFKGLMQEVCFLIPNYQKLNLRLWYNEADRNLPIYTGIISQRNQQDQNLKANIDWNYSRNNLNNTLRFGFLNDKIIYNDSAIQLQSTNQLNTFIAESDNYYTIQNHRFNFGINYTTYHVYVSENIPQTSLNKLALYAAYQVRFLKDKMKYHLSIRKEFSEPFQIPFTGNTGLLFEMNKIINLKINGGKSFRQPTLNDLYWNPGGNINLKPEEAYDFDGGIEFHYSKNNYHINIEATYFNRHTNNWIIWLPSENGYWSPSNLAKVYSRGTETSSEIRWVKKDFGVTLKISTSYVLSTNEATTNINDKSEGRQLIYTPRYTGNGNLQFSYKRFSILYSQGYTGYRFTATDNSSWLPPYSIGNIKLSYGYRMKNLDAEFYFNINNLLNKNYMIVKNTPMPMRNVEGGITLHYHKKNKPTNHL